MTFHRMAQRVLRLGLLLLVMTAKTAGATLGYDENADAGKTVKEALTAAANSHKNVLMIFGANWCAACRQFDNSMREGKIRLDESQYIPVKIDVGHFDRNLDLARAYGNPIRKGIPAASVVTPDNRILYSGSLENFLMPYRRLAKIAVSAIGLLPAMLIACAAFMTLRRKLS